MKQLSVKISFKQLVTTSAHTVSTNLGHFVNLQNNSNIAFEQLSVHLSQRYHYVLILDKQLQPSEIVKIEQNSVNSDLIQFSPKHRGYCAKYLKQQQVMFITAIFNNMMRYECLKVQIIKRGRFSV
ncbi:Hypothetical_protein [Hexamita inflata]|uniref:Hypothetical_protein n=1 Tax=Hexamita inflata TaxID=28002 RepID=A0AA86N6C4_9EUKA|nr:Hypothetical protein HINF_LOCUS1303 [Hexamita inflata]CAI9925894.1 Hypothetical protein HINF_LOCUS13539 [Hexamita inflata]CAI9978516.1 Hypothetical protein HINF_LOCUS66161 [Hexamita inflata]